MILIVTSKDLKQSHLPFNFEKVERSDFRELVAQTMNRAAKVVFRDGTHVRLLKNRFGSLDAQILEQDIRT